MRISFAVALLAADAAVASSWFSKAAYNKWHETELERWLSDHSVPYPAPADRRDLQDLVKTNWDAATTSPYVNWDTNQLSKYLSSTGKSAQKGTEKNKNALVEQVKSAWTDTSDSASSAYGSVQSWIFDSWTDSQLKSFADRHSIPVPQPRKRDSLLKAVRENYQSAANKLGETAAYPGDWLYASWSDSDLKAWLDERGIPVPQPNTRDSMIASVRRNARSASLNSKSASKSAASSMSSSANAAQSGLTDKIFDSWSDSELKTWADKNSIKVPQGSTRNEMLAIARKNIAKLSGDNASASASSAGSSATSQGAAAMGAATSSAGNEYARATEDASLKANNWYGAAYSQAMQYYDDAQLALGLKTNYASSASKSAASASKSAASAYAKASKGAKGEL